MIHLMKEVKNETNVMGMKKKLLDIIMTTLNVFIEGVNQEIKPKTGGHFTLKISKNVGMDIVLKINIWQVTLYDCAYYKIKDLRNRFIIINDVKNLIDQLRCKHNLY